MVLALLVALNASSLCVTSTNICAPAGSTVEGTIGQSGGQVTITPSKPLRALGGEFRAKTKVIVSVVPWGGSGGHGAIVHVSGELTHEMVISGARVAGTVRIGQMQGTKAPPQLVEATDFKGGTLKVGAGGTVDVGPGMRITGGVDLGSVRLDITSAQPIHALGLDLAAGTVRVEQQSNGTTIGGMLVRPQDVGGVLVEKQLYATLDGNVPHFGTATLSRATPLRAFGLPDGSAPAGTLVRALASETKLIGPGPITVCGLSLAAVAGVGEPAVSFTPAGPPAHVVVTGTLGRDIDVGGVHMTGAVSLRYASSGCKLVGLEGTLARATELHGLLFAAKTAFASGEFSPGADPIMRGTLAKPAVVDGLTLKGIAMVRTPSTGDVHVLDATLAKAAPFEDWQVPAGTQVQRSGTIWSFTVPTGQSARATAVHRGERVDFVIDARSDDSSSSFTLLRPHTPKGTTLSLQSISIDHQTGCVLGDLATAQSFGIFTIPKGGNATLCGGKIQAAEGTYAVPSLQVGKWFATSAIAGDPKSPPVSRRTPIGNAPAPSSTAPTGYWIQINSLCQSPGGIPQPPPEETWIFVDLKGDAKTAADRKNLSLLAARRGTACPVVPCCPP
jgi:hypothetical protein